MNARRQTFAERMALLWGKVRRQWLHLVRPGYVRDRLARRRGDCARCGACCRLALYCRSLDFGDDGLSACRLYGRYRPPNCRNFPIDERDLADRDLVAPGTRCGFYWDRAQSG